MSQEALSALILCTGDFAMMMSVFPLSWAFMPLFAPPRYLRMSEKVAQGMLVQILKTKRCSVWHKNVVAPRHILDVPYPKIYFKQSLNSPIILGNANTSKGEGSGQK